MAQSSHQDQLQAAYAAQLEWQEEERTKHWDEFLLKTTPREKDAQYDLRQLAVNFINEVFPQLDPSLARELHELVMAGIPREIRGLWWKHLLDVSLRRGGKTYYSEILVNSALGPLADKQTLELDDIKSHLGTLAPCASTLDSTIAVSYEQLWRSHARVWLQQIEKDLPRTFAFHPKMNSQSGEGLPTLRRVLAAFTKHDPETGYCQGMNFIVGVLLMFMSEEEAFYCLTILVQDVLRGYFAPDMLATKIDQRVFQKLIYDKLPVIATHLEAVDADIGCVFAQWFMCAFVNSLPLETCLRVWDVLFFVKSKSVLFQVGLALVDMYGDALLDAKDVLEAFQVVQAMASMTFDAGKLLKMARDKYASVDDALLASLREYYQEEVAREDEENRENRTSRQGLGDSLKSDSKVPAMFRSILAHINAKTIKAGLRQTNTGSDSDRIQGRSTPMGDSDTESDYVRGGNEQKGPGGLLSSMFSSTPLSNASISAAGATTGTGGSGGGGGRAGVAAVPESTADTPLLSGAGAAAAGAVGNAADGVAPSGPVGNAGAPGSSPPGNAASREGTYEPPIAHFPQIEEFTSDLDPILSSQVPDIDLITMASLPAGQPITPGISGSQQLPSHVALKRLGSKAALDVGPHGLQDEDGVSTQGVATPSSLAALSKRPSLVRQAAAAQSVDQQLASHADTGPSSPQASTLHASLNYKAADSIWSDNPSNLAVLPVPIPKTAVMTNNTALQSTSPSASAFQTFQYQLGPEGLSAAFQSNTVSSLAGASNGNSQPASVSVSRLGSTNVDATSTVTINNPTVSSGTEKGGFNVTIDRVVPASLLREEGNINNGGGGGGGGGGAFSSMSSIAGEKLTSSGQTRPLQQEQLSIAMQHALQIARSGLVTSSSVSYGQDGSSRQPQHAQHDLINLESARLASGAMDPNQDPLHTIASLSGQHPPGLMSDLTTMQAQGFQSNLGQHTGPYPDNLGSAMYAGYVDTINQGLYPGDNSGQQMHLGNAAGVAGFQGVAPYGMEVGSAQSGFSTGFSSVPENLDALSSGGLLPTSSSTNYGNNAQLAIATNEGFNDWVEVGQDAQSVPHDHLNVHGQHHPLMSVQHHLGSAHHSPQAHKAYRNGHSHGSHHSPGVALAGSAHRLSVEKPSLSRGGSSAVGHFHSPHRLGVSSSQQIEPYMLGNTAGHQMSRSPHHHNHHPLHTVASESKALARSLSNGWLDAGIPLTNTSASVPPRGSTGSVAAYPPAVQNNGFHVQNGGAQHAELPGTTLHASVTGDGNVTLLTSTAGVLTPTRAAHSNSQIHVPQEAVQNVLEKHAVHSVVSKLSALPVQLHNSLHSSGALTSNDGMLKQASDSCNEASQKLVDMAQSLAKKELQIQQMQEELQRLRLQAMAQSAPGLQQYIPQRNAQAMEAIHAATLGNASAASAQHGVDTLNRSLHKGYGSSGALLGVAINGASGGPGSAGETGGGSTGGGGGGVYGMTPASGVGTQITANVLPGGQVTATTSVATNGAVMLNQQFTQSEPAFNKTAVGAAMNNNNNLRQSMKQSGSAAIESGFQSVAYAQRALQSGPVQELMNAQQGSSAETVPSLQGWCSEKGDDLGAPRDYPQGAR